MGERGPEAYRANEYELGAAYAFYELYPQSNRYKNYYVLYERDYLSENDTEEERRRRALQAEKDTGIFVKRRKKNGNINVRIVKPSDDPDYARRNRALLEVKKRINEELDYNNGCFPIRIGINKEKLIHWILDSYPEPSFLCNGVNREWTGELMHSLFSANGKLFKERWIRCRGNSILSARKYNMDTSFVIKVGKGGIIKIRSLDFSVEDYNEAIDSYIKMATNKNLGLNIDKNNCEVYKLSIVPNLKNTITALTHSRMDKRNCIYFGIYTVAFKAGRKTKPCVVNSVILPRYPYNEVEYIVKTANRESVNNRTLFPLTALFVDDYKFKNRPYAYKDYEVFEKYINKCLVALNRKRWTGRRYKVRDDSLVIVIPGSKEKVFILKKTVYNAKIVKDYYKYKTTKKRM